MSIKCPRCGNELSIASLAGKCLHCNAVIREKKPRQPTTEQWQDWWNKFPYASYPEDQIKDD